MPRTQDPIPTIARDLSLRSKQVSAAVRLLKDGATIPFIARYRKEATGSLDAARLVEIRDRLEEHEKLESRRASILASLEEREKLTPELRRAVEGAATRAELEDIYHPHRKKRRTRATRALEKGLEPLAKQIYEERDERNLAARARGFVDSEKGVDSVEEAVAGARDIVADWIASDPGIRGEMRSFCERKSRLRSRVKKGKKEEGRTYRDYFDWDEAAFEAPSHRVLACFRGEEEGILRLKVAPPKKKAIAHLLHQLRQKGRVGRELEAAAEEAWKRLLGPSLENECRNLLKEAADEEAIRIFADNLRQLLLAPPLGRKRVLAVDPGLRTGCKVVCLGRQGEVIQQAVLHLQRADKKAGRRLVELCREFDIEALAIGKGTGGRKALSFCRTLDLPNDPPLVPVEERGASVYSASEIAREELPDLDVTLRGAVSIGRRLQDPLAELVKVDPRSLGVGQYQHDVDQGALQKRLDDVVIDCVNTVGVELNSASPRLLTYVSGVGPSLARSIVEYRTEKGRFRTRSELLDVSGVGPRTYELAAGFLRIREGDHPLDRTAVHPERYDLVRRMARDAGCSLEDLVASPDRLAAIDLKRYVDREAGVGLPTLEDILDELKRPGRDPRESFQPVEFAENVTDIDDLTEGMRLPGVVTNITAFGAFIDLGIKRDGLVHISQMADRYVDDPHEIVSLGETVNVKVLEVDRDRNRISLSLKE